MASLSAAAAEALRTRGVSDPAAALAADSGVAIFKTAFEVWVADGGTIAERMREALAQLRAAVR